jgi:hypothetical protein
MARYTDIDKLIAEYDRVHVGPAGGARKLMVEAPIADVAPRAEIAREIIEDIATLIEAHWSEIQHGVYWLVCGRCIPLRELLKTVEKKYTEGLK